MKIVTVRFRPRRWVQVIGLAVACIAGAAGPSLAQKVDPDGLDYETVRKLVPEYFRGHQVVEPMVGRRDGMPEPEALPDIDGPGAVLSVGQVFMKVTNWGHLGNLFTNRSSDPSAQWPGASSIEYLSSVRLSVGAVNPLATDPTSVRRVSYLLEWRPATLDPEDKIYRAYDGIINGQRFENDDGDQDDSHPPLTEEIIDEDFLDGRDNDGDEKIDEDHAAIGQQTFSMVMRDDTVEAVNTVFNERHVPLGLECRQRSWAYALPGFDNFNITEYEIFNRSGHNLDSLFVGFLVDMDSGPIVESNFFSDDFDIPSLPNGEFTIRVGATDGDLQDPLRRQLPHSEQLNGDFPPDSALCPSLTLRINGFSIVDDNGDNDRTPGTPHFFLVDHTVDPLGISAPQRVGFNHFRSFTSGTPFESGGHPTIDDGKWQLLSSTGDAAQSNIDPETGFIQLEPGETKGDFLEWCSIGPYRFVPDGGSIKVTIGFGVSPGEYAVMSRYPRDYQNYLAGLMSGKELMDKYPPLANAWAAQIAFEGINEARPKFPRTDFHGREIGLRARRGESPYFMADCRDDAIGNQRLVNELDYTWFDFDCNYCTGVWDATVGTASNPRLGGMFHKIWNAEAPPPSPTANTSALFNFTANPDRTQDLVAAGDKAIALAWDNLSEFTADPKSGMFDFRGYQIWKVSDWTRPVGAGGPAEGDWKLLGSFRKFDYYTITVDVIQNNFQDSAGVAICPSVFIPAYLNPVTGLRDTATIPICLERGDLWNRQTGEIIRPDWTSFCALAPDSDDAVVEVNSGDIARYGGSYAHTFANAGEYRYVCNRHPEHEGSVVVAAGEPDEAVVRITGYGADAFDPPVARIRPGGGVRWVNEHMGTHTVSPDRDCELIDGCIVHAFPCSDARNRRKIPKYPIGRYRLVDREVKNGFLYFYSITAFDSTNGIELAGRRAAVEAEAVVPQAQAKTSKGVWVVPNPYRGFARLSDRPSAWDLTPNATDPTGTHIDFMGLPEGEWTVKVFTVSGDLVAELHSTDPVNDSVRSSVKDAQGNTYPGYNVQQDNPNDGEARWNLISRNGQDVVSGIYVFTVESKYGTERGRFVVIR